MNKPDPNLPLWLTLLLLSEQATRDWLTGLYNRRYFEETLADHIETAKRYDRKLSLVIFDLNDFKAINDAGGHKEGDSALRRFSELLRSTARSADIICRIGGDEFAVLLPETENSNAWKFVERVQTNQKSPTVTAGVAALPAADLFKEADADLMKRKREREGGTTYFLKK
ncbi:GGDEF domain-containing protein [Pontiellaceae bacterium B12219]|nr:GGDEF domain-containing protein [Pontiellaceae bacterium B12219]